MLHDLGFGQIFKQFWKVKVLKGIKKGLQQEQMYLTSLHLCDFVQHGSFNHEDFYNVQTPLG